MKKDKDDSVIRHHMVRVAARLKEELNDVVHEEFRRLGASWPRDTEDSQRLGEAIDRAREDLALAIATAEWHQIKRKSDKSRRGGGFGDAGVGRVLASIF